MATESIKPLTEYQPYVYCAGSNEQVFVRRWTDGRWFNGHMKAASDSVSRKLEKLRRERTHVRL